MAFLENLIFNEESTEFITQPIPPEVGKLQFSVVRNKSFMNKLAPSYYLYLEKGNEGQILVLYGKKVAFKKQSYYLISTRKDKRQGNTRDSGTCVGKLRALNPSAAASKFVLYDNGENYQKQGIAFRNIRREHGAFILRYDACNEGDIRRMTVILPALTKVPL